MFTRLRKDVESVFSRDPAAISQEQEPTSPSKLMGRAFLFCGNVRTFPRG